MRRLIPEIKKMLSTRDLLPKIVCLLLSVMLWVYINSTKVGDVKFRIPIEFKNISKELIISEVQSRYITVTLTGRKDVIKNVNLKNISAFVNIENPAIGISRRYPIKVIKHGIPENIDLTLSLRDINLTVEKKIKKRVKVEPDILKKVREGYVIGYVKVDPQYVIIDGPESIVKSVNIVRTAMVSVGNDIGRIEKDVAIDKSNLPNVDINISNVKVIIPVVESTNLYKFEMKIEIKNPVEGLDYVLNKQSVKIYLRSEEEDFEPSKEDIAAYIDVSTIDMDDLAEIGDKKSLDKDYLVNIELKQEGMEVVTVLPGMISVKIKKTESIQPK